MKIQWRAVGNKAFKTNGQELPTQEFVKRN